MQKITTYLWFNDNAEEAVNYYTSLFKDSKIISISRYSEGMPMPEGTAMVIAFQLAGQEFLALNGGPHFKFTEAISLSVDCEDQGEVDRLWKSLTSNGGQESMCGWLKDKYGLSWQIVPSILPKLMTNGNPKQVANVGQALMKMRRIVISDLEEAYNK